MWGEYFAGTIDEVRVYNRALSATEIQADMTVPAGGPPPPPPLPAMSIADASITEGNGVTAIEFTVTLSAAAAGSVTASYATADGSATAGSDYTPSSGAVNFAPGQTSQTIGIAVNGDATTEPNETFTVTLSAPTGATLVDATAIGTLLNDDVPPDTTPPSITGARPRRAPLASATSRW